MRCLVIDDMRNIDADYTARTFQDGIRALKEDGPWDVLFLDHDLGSPDVDATGYGVMCFLEEHPEFLPGEIILVTSNPVGRENMQVVIDRLYYQSEGEK